MCQAVKHARPVSKKRVTRVFRAYSFACVCGRKARGGYPVKLDDEGKPPPLDKQAAKCLRVVVHDGTPIVIGCGKTLQEVDDIVAVDRLEKKLSGEQGRKF